MAIASWDRFSHLRISYLEVMKILKFQPVDSFVKLNKSNFKLNSRYMSRRLVFQLTRCLIIITMIITIWNQLFKSVACSIRYGPVDYCRSR